MFTITELELMLDNAMFALIEANYAGKEDQKEQQKALVKKLRAAVFAAKFPETN